MNKEALFNVCNFKTKPPDDEWSTPYDRALQNTAFVEKMMRGPPCVRAFRKARRKLSQNRKKYNNS